MLASPAIMNPSPNLILVGPMGAGKSTIGRRLAEHFGLVFVDLDHEIESQTGATVRLIFELEGEAGFRKRETATLASLTEARGILLATGGGSVLVAENRASLKRAGFVVYLQVTIEQQLQRLERDRNRPLLAAPDRRQRLEALAAERGPLYAEVADLTVPGENLSVVAASKRIALELEQRWHRSTENVA